MTRWPGENRRDKREVEEREQQEREESERERQDKKDEKEEIHEDQERQEWMVPPALAKSDQPYRDSHEHLLDEFCRIDFILWLRVKQWRAEMGESAGEFAGYYIPDEKVDQLLRPESNEWYDSDPVSSGVLYEEQFELTGGNIKNIALTAAFIAAEPRTDEAEAMYDAEREAIRELISEEIAKNGELDLKFFDLVKMEHVVWAMRREFQKTGKLIKQEAFGEYQELLPH